jgi:hypothetical protein
MEISNQKSADGKPTSAEHINTPDTNAHKEHLRAATAQLLEKYDHHQPHKQIAGAIFGTYITIKRLIYWGIGLLFVIGLVVALFNTIFFPLNENSTCSRFEQADAGTQNSVLQSMVQAHGGSTSSVPLTNTSVNLYCSLYPNNPINGVYQSGGVGQ